MIGDRSPCSLPFRPGLEPPEDEEEEERAKDARDAESENPTRIAVVWDAGDPGREVGLETSMDSRMSGLWLSVSKLSLLCLLLPGRMKALARVLSFSGVGWLAGLSLRIVRPPDGNTVRDDPVSCTVVERTQRSGAPYWYASMSLTLGGGRRVSRASN